MPETDPLLALFARYNPAIWPAQLVAYVAAAVLIALVVVRPSRPDGPARERVPRDGLAVHRRRLSRAVRARRWTPPRASSTPRRSSCRASCSCSSASCVTASPIGPPVPRPSMVGWAAIAYALVVYPLIGIALGHPYPQAPLFGAAPCPTTIVTFGLLLLARPPLPKVLLIVPLAWALVATPAAVGRGVLEDVALLGVGLVGVALIVARDRRGAGTGRSRAAPPRPRPSASADRTKGASVNDVGTDRLPGDWYEIVLGRQLGGRSAALFAELELVEIPGDGMLLRGVFADQAALHGVLARIRDLGVPLLAVRVIVGRAGRAPARVDRAAALDEPEPARLGDEPDAVARADLAEQVVDVPLRRPGRDEERAPDLLVRQPGGHEAQHLELAHAERLERGPAVRPGAGSRSPRAAVRRRRVPTRRLARRSPSTKAGATWRTARQEVVAREHRIEEDAPIALRARRSLTASAMAAAAARPISQSVTRVREGRERRDQPPEPTVARAARPRAASSDLERLGRLGLARRARAPTSGGSGRGSCPSTSRCTGGAPSSSLRAPPGSPSSRRSSAASQGHGHHDAHDPHAVRLAADRLEAASTPGRARRARCSARTSYHSDAPSIVIRRRARSHSSWPVAMCWRAWTSSSASKSAAPSGRWTIPSHDGVARPARRDLVDRPPAQGLRLAAPA